MTINNIHILSNVVKNFQIKEIAEFSQFLKNFQDIFAYNSKTVLATNPGVVSFKR